MKAQNNKFKIGFELKFYLKFGAEFKKKYMEENLQNQNVSSTQIPSQVQPPKDPTTNSRRLIPVIIGIIILLLIVVVIGGTYYLGIRQASLASPTKQTPQTSPATNKISAISKFVYFERTLAKNPTNPLTLGGIEYKDQFVVYDITTKSKSPFYEEATFQDNVDSYRLLDNQYLLIASPRGNRTLTLQGQRGPNLSDDYYSGIVSPSGKVQVNYKITETAITFSITDVKTNTKKDVSMSNKNFLVPNIIGWSNDENSLYFTLIQTEVVDPTRSLYELNINAGEVKVFPRDSAIGYVENTFINSERNEIYFVAKNGLFMQPTTALKATNIQLKEIDGSKVVSIVFPLNYEKHALAISDVKNLIIKDIDSGEENLVFKAHSDGSVYPASWNEDNLIYFFRKEGSTGNEKQFGYYIVGNIYNLLNRSSIEFANHKTDSMFTVGRVYFIDWLK